MLQAKTHFQQLPVEDAKKILKQEEAKAALATAATNPVRVLSSVRNTKDSKKVSR